MIERSCQVCGKHFEVHPSRVKHGRGLHCSSGCQYAAKRAAPRTMHTCVGCGSAFARPPSQTARRGGGKYCSRECRDKNWIGGATPNWQNGDKVYKRGPRWFSIRRRILKRDGACVCCGETKGLHVHHITPFRMFANADDANVDSNLVALCPPCHRRADAGFKWVRLPDSGAVIQMNAGGYAWQLARERGLI